MTILNNDQWQEALVQLANSGISVSNADANGQATMANSAPVVLASDQSKLPTKAASGDFVAGSIVDLATLAAIVSGGKAAVKAGAGDFTDLATIAAAISGGRILTTPPSVNADVVLLASGTYSSNQAPANQTNLYGKGLYVFITTGAFGASAATIVVNINAVDPSSGANSLLLASAALTASSSTVLQIYPAISTTANQKLNGALPKTWNITVTAANWGTGGSVIGVGASVIL